MDDAMDPVVPAGECPVSPGTSQGTSEGTESKPQSKRLLTMKTLNHIVSNVAEPRISVDSTVEKVLHEVSTVRSKQLSKSFSLLPKGVDDDDDCNFTIFTEEGSLPRFMLIRFKSPVAIRLDRLRIAFAIWTVVYIPILLCFIGTDITVHHFLQALDIAGDILFLVTVPLAFFTTVGNAAAGREYLSPKTIMKRRLLSCTFWCDVLSVLPFAVGLCAGHTALPYPAFLRKLQLLKLLRIHWILWMPASHFETRFMSRLQIVRMIGWVALSMHFMACIWYYVVVGNDTLDSHLQHLVDISPGAHYSLALTYGVYTLTGIPVDAYSVDELWLIDISAVIGGIFLAFIYGNTTMLLSRMNIQMNKHHKHVAVIQRTLRSLNIPKELKQRITQYHHFLAVHHNTQAFTSLMQGLSVNLFIELRAHLFKTLFKMGPFFEGAPASFLRTLLRIMVEVAFCPGDIVIRCGDVGNQMYFVVKGKLEVLSAGNEVIGKLGENEYFGEVALVVETPRLVTIRTSTYCLLAMITRDDFMPILQEHPYLKKRMLQKIKLYTAPEEDREGRHEAIGRISEHTAGSGHSNRTFSKESKNSKGSKSSKGTSCSRTQSCIDASVASCSSLVPPTVRRSTIADVSNVSTNLVANKGDDSVRRHSHAGTLQRGSSSSSAHRDGGEGSEYEQGSGEGEPPAPACARPSKTWLSPACADTSNMGLSARPAPGRILNNVTNGATEEMALSHAIIERFIEMEEKLSGMLSDTQSRIKRKFEDRLQDELEKLKRLQRSWNADSKMESSSNLLTPRTSIRSAREADFSSSSCPLREAPVSRSASLNVHRAFGSLSVTQAPVRSSSITGREARAQALTANISIHQAST